MCDIKSWRVGMKMGIFDLDAHLLKLAKEKMGMFEPFINKVDTSTLTVQNQESYGLEIISSKPQGTMFVGESVLRNQTNDPQTINSDTFTKTVTDSVTLSVTNGISTGVNVSIGGKVFGMGVETSMSFEVSTSTTEEQTNEESVAYTVPSQPVTIPPQSTRYVYATLEKSELEGIIRLKADLSGQFAAIIKIDTVESPSHFDLYELVKEFQLKYPLPSGITLNHNNKTIHFEGVAEYYYGTGTKFNVTITDTPSSSKTLDEKSYDSTTGLGTYQISLDNKKLGSTLDDFKEQLEPEVFEKLKELEKQRQ
jgi:hypothetical protein